MSADVDSDYSCYQPDPNIPPFLIGPAELIFLLRVEGATHERIQEHNDSERDNLVKDLHLESEEEGN